MNIEYKMIEKNEIDGRVWDNFVLNNSQCHRMQTSLWADTKALTGWVIHYLTAWENGNLVAGAQLYEHRIPLFGSVTCLPKGPLSDSFHTDLLPDLITQIKRWAKDRHKFCLLVQPADQEQFLVKQLLNEFFYKLPDENIVPPGTIVLDLKPDANTLFKNMTHSRQRNVHRAQKAGIVVKEGTTQDIDTFYSLYQNTGNYLHFDLDDKSRFENIWRILNIEGHIKMFISTFEGQPLSAMLILCFGQTATAWRFGSSRELTEKHPNDALVWHAILWAKENNFQYFDFGEIHLGAARKLCQEHTAPEEHLDLGAYSNTSEMFKLSFGGTPVLYPETYAYFTNTGMRWLYASFISKLMGLPIAQRLMAFMA